MEYFRKNDLYDPIGGISPEYQLVFLTVNPALVLTSLITFARNKSVCWAFSNSLDFRIDRDIIWFFQFCTTFLIPALVCSTTVCLHRRLFNYLRALLYCI